MRSTTTRRFVARAHELFTAQNFVLALAAFALLAALGCQSALQPFDEIEAPQDEAQTMQDESPAQLAARAEAQTLARAGGARAEAQPLETDGVMRDKSSASSLARDESRAAAQKPVLLSSPGAVLVPPPGVAVTPPPGADALLARLRAKSSGDARLDTAALQRTLRRTESSLGKSAFGAASTTAGATAAASAPTAAADALEAALAEAARSSSSAPPAARAPASIVPPSSASASQHASRALAALDESPALAAQHALRALAALDESSAPATSPPPSSPPLTTVPFAPPAFLSEPPTPSSPPFAPVPSSSPVRVRDDFDTRFTVRTGLLSDNVRTLVRGFDWQLKWPGETDRRIEAPFSIPRDTLEATLRRLLELYEGQFVADLYQANRMVVVAPAPPGVEIREAGAPPRAPRRTVREKSGSWLRFPDADEQRIQELN